MRVKLQEGSLAANAACCGEAGLRRESPGNGRGHGQRVSGGADGDFGDQVEQKFVTIVIAQTEYRLRKPAFF